MLAKIGDYFVIINSKNMACAFSDEDNKDDAPARADNFAGWLVQELRAFIPYVKRIEPVKGVMPSGKKVDLATPDRPS